MKLAYQRWNHHRPKLVLLHGMGGTSQIWRPLARALEPSIEILGLDQRGHGESQNPELSSYAPEDYAQDVAETLESLNFTPTWVLGHSMGVQTALALAALHPQGIQGLFLIDLGLSEKIIQQGLLECFQACPPSFSSEENLQKFLDQYPLDTSIKRYLIAIAKTKSPLGFPFDPQALIQTILTPKAPLETWLETLGRKHLPVLLLRGARSHIWSEASFLSSQKHYENFPSLVFEEVPDTGHGLPFEKRNLLVERIQAWMTRT